MPAERPLSKVLLDRCDSAVAQATLLPDLEERLVAIVERCQGTWPRIAVDEEAFVAHLAARLPTDGELADGLGVLHGPDLWLAFACSRGDARAIGELEKIVQRDAVPALARTVQGAQRDDVLQILRDKLLVHDGDRAPKIGEYAGRGPLGGWLRVAAVRTAISVVRKKGPTSEEAVPREALLDVADPVASDPELLHVRAHHQQDFKDAFQQALGELSAQERNVLRLYLVDGLNIDQIGGMYNVHRATVARWIARSRETVRDRTRELIGARLHLSGRELDSLVGAVQSQIDVSLSRILRAG